MPRGLYVPKCDMCGTLGDGTTLREAQAAAVLHRANETESLDHAVYVAPVVVWHPPQPGENVI